MVLRTIKGSQNVIRRLQRYERFKDVVIKVIVYERLYPSLLPK